MDDRICYDFFCPKFGSCVRARGKGCAVREQEYTLPDGRSSQVQPGECTKDNGFALYSPDSWARRQEFRARMG